MNTILLIDDQMIIRRGFKAILEAEGYCVQEARDGEQALELLKKSIPDLILLDVVMPKMNGFTTFRAIRARGISTPIIFLTASTSDCDEVRALSNGADDFINKNTSQNVLIARIDRILNRKPVLASQPSFFSDELNLPRTRQILLGEALIDFDRLTIKGPDLNERLTKTEADFLWLLNSNRGKNFSYTEIFDILRGEDYIGDERTLHVHMSRLRHKLGPYGKYLHNNRGEGYALLSEDEL